MRSIFSLFFFASYLLLLSCSDRKAEAILDQAENIIQENPAEALSLLQAIDVSQLHSRRLEARYALTYTIAQYKSYLDPESDSLVSVAVDYYEMNGSAEEKFYAYLYQGIIRSIIGNKQQTSYSLFRALYNSESVIDHYSKGQLYMYLASLYSGLNNKETLKFARQAAHEYEEADLIQYYLNAKTNEATARLHLLEFEEAEVLIDSIHSLALELDDTASICGILSVEASNAIAKDSLDLATQIFSALQDNYGYELTAQDMGNLSLLSISQSKEEEAWKWMDAARQTVSSVGDTLEFYADMSMLYGALHDDSKVISYKDSILSIFERLYLEEQQHAEYAEKCNYLELKEQQAETRNRTIKAYLTTGLCILVLISLLLASTLQKNKVQSKMQMEIIKNLKLELALHSQERADALSLLKSDIFAKIVTIRLEDKKGLSHDDQSYIHHQFNQQLPEFQDALNRLVKLSETELLVCYLVKIGLYPNEIAILCNKTAQAISQIRTRLYMKAFRKKGKTTDWDNFINSI